MFLYACCKISWGETMKLTISLAQMDVIGGEPEKNLDKGSVFIAEAINRDSDLVVFPEMWTTGFNWKRNREIASKQEAILEQIADMAKESRMWINGSMLALNENGEVANTSILYSPDGERAAVYRKVHLFSFHGEDKHMAPGDGLATAETPWGKVGLAVCYDIRFPELFRSYALQGVEMILSPIAFPHPRLEHWKILSRARAIENQFFMVSTNQVGLADRAKGEEIRFFGHSAIIDPWGEAVVEGNDSDEELLTATVDMEMVEDIREKMKVFQDRKPEVYELG